MNARISVATALSIALAGIVLTSSIVVGFSSEESQTPTNNRDLVETLEVRSSFDSTRTETVGCISGFNTCTSSTDSSVNLGTNSGEISVSGHSFVGGVAALGSTTLVSENWVSTTGGEETITTTYSLSGDSYQERFGSGLDVTATRTVVSTDLVVVNRDTGGVVQTKTVKNHDVLTPGLSELTEDTIVTTIQTVFGRVLSALNIGDLVSRSLSGLFVGSVSESVNERSVQRDLDTGRQTIEITYQAEPGTEYALGITTIAVAGGVGSIGDITSEVNVNSQVHSITRTSKAQVDASIVKVNAPSGTFAPGEEVKTTFVIQNTGTSEHTFFAGYSVFSPDGRAWDNGGTTGTPVTIAPGAQKEVTVSWTAEEQAPEGIYDVGVAVWKESDRDALATRLDMVFREDVFVLERPEVSGPTADAGRDLIVSEGTQVTLDGTQSSGLDGDPLTHSWVQLSGPNVVLQDATTATPEFTAPDVTAPTTLTFRLIVLDNQTSDTDTVNVTVAPEAQPDIAVTPVSHDYGDIPVASSGSQIVTISNNGDAPLSVSTLKLAGPNADEFNIVVGGGPFTLSSGESQDITVEFTPTSESSKSASLIIESNDPDEPLLGIELTGTGTPVEPDPLPNVTLVKDNDANRDGIFTDTEEAPAGGSEVTFRATITNNENENLTVDSIIDSVHGVGTPATGLPYCGDVTALNASETKICYFNGTVVDDDAITETNILTVRVSDDDANELSVSDSSNVTVSDIRPAITVVKDNDADDDGTFSDSETAVGPGVNATFRVKVTNKVAENVTITSLGDSLHNVNNSAGNLDANGCVDLFGMVLKPGQTVTCHFNGTVTSTPLDTEVNTATVTVNDDDGNTNASMDTSVVHTPRNLTVTIDIKPGGDTNPINPNSRGVTPVAILNTARLDSTEVDVSSLRFGSTDVVATGNGATPAHDGHFTDVNNDGKIDLVLHFETQASGFERGDDTGRLVGETTDGIPISGTDTVRIVGKKRPALYLLSRG